MISQIRFLLTTCFKHIMFNEKNKLKNTNNHILKVLDKSKDIDYWHHLWIFSNARIVQRTPGSDSAPPNYQKWPGCCLFHKNASRTLFKHILRFPDQSNIFYYAVKPQNQSNIHVSLQIRFLLTTCFKHIMFNEKNKLTITNNHIQKC